MKRTPLARSDYVCEHVPISAQSGVMVLRVPAPAGSVLVECPCCHVQGYDDPTVVDDPMVCPYCDVEGVPYREGAA